MPGYEPFLLCDFHVHTTWSDGRQHVRQLPMDPVPRIVTAADAMKAIATGSWLSADRVRANGAREVIDYSDPSWPQCAKALANGSIDAVANAARGGAAAAMTALADGGRLATITPDPPAPTRGINVTAVYVRSDGAQLDRLTALLESHRLSVPLPRSCSLDRAGYALARVAAGHEPSGVVIVNGTSNFRAQTPKTSHHQGVSR